jgi:hypothetical protein
MKQIRLSVTDQYIGGADRAQGKREKENRREAVLVYVRPERPVENHDITFRASPSFLLHAGAIIAKTFPELSKEENGSI